MTASDGDAIYEDMENWNELRLVLAVRYALIGWEETTSGIGAANWLLRAAPSKRFVYRTNSLVNQLVAAKSGIGLALLPCYLADGEVE